MTFTVIKRDYRGRPQLSYQGEVFARGAGWVCVVAPFTFGDRDLGYIYLRQGDIFTEWFYNDRWYNIFRVEDGQSGALKGWYCNITRPAEIEIDRVAADDLALDLFIYPDGQSLLLDQEEFETLPLGADERQHALAAVQAVLALVKARAGPFADIARP